MELFVYNWFYTGFTIYGHCLDINGEYKLLKVRNFLPSCYVEGETVRPSSTVVPVQAEYRRMLSSRDISSQRPFHLLSFQNAKDMSHFSQDGRCYMADIPQVTNFLSQIQADHVGWVKVNCSAAQKCATVGMLDIVSMPDKIPPFTPKVLSFDIEVRSLDAGMPQPYRIRDTVEMISVVTFCNGQALSTYIIHAMDEPFDIEDALDIRCADEIDMITRFFTLIKEEDPTIITGYNIYGFDIHYLVSRLKLRLVEIPDVSRGLPNSIDLIKVDWTSNAYGHNTYDRLVIGGRVIIDMYLYFKRMKLDKYSLEFVSGKFLGEGKNDMPYAKMADAFQSGDVDVLRDVARYCIRDSVLVMKLFDKVQMWIDVCEVSKITRCNIEDIYTRGEQMKMVSQCVAECAKRNIVLQPQFPSEWRQYEGAYVLEPVKGVYHGCSILDFQSLYPSIIIAYNICPSTYTRFADSNSHAVKDTQHYFRKKPVGLIPGMIKRILDERKAVKAQMVDISDKSSVEYIVLDRRQNALKICANSVYGMMGFKNSRYFGHLGCAESITTIGRQLLTDIVQKIENTYPVKVVYGDSVTGYTPTIVRIDKKTVFLETFDNLAVKWGGDEWVQSDSKESCELYGVEVWTEDGWTMVHRVIRHILAPNKKIIRIRTHTGLVDVTDEHSLLSADGNSVDAKEVKIGDELLHYSYPPLPDEATSCYAADVGAAERTEQIVLHEILNSNLEVRQAFWNGFYDSDKVIYRKHQVTIASFAMIASSLGYGTSLNTKLDIYILTVTKAAPRTPAMAVLKKQEIEYTGYVYDITTSNHHFQAGPGNMIVHNTDSCMLWHNDCENHVKLAKSICNDVTASLPAPMALKFETYCDKVILLTKKRYILVSGSGVSYKGVMNARRDYCAYAKKTYSEIMELIAKDVKKSDIVEFIDKKIFLLLSGKVPTQDLIVTKSLARKLSTYKVNQPHVVMARRLVEKNGIDIPAGTRLEYIFVKGDIKMVTPEEFEKESFSIDCKFYVEKQLATQIDDILSVIGMGNFIKDSWL